MTTREIKMQQFKAAIKHFPYVALARAREIRAIDIANGDETHYYDMLHEVIQQNPKHKIKVKPSLHIYDKDY